MCIRATLEFARQLLHLTATQTRTYPRFLPYVLRPVTAGFTPFLNRALRHTKLTCYLFTRLPCIQHSQAARSAFIALFVRSFRPHTAQF